MHKDHRLAALKLYEKRLESSVSEVHAPGVGEVSVPTLFAQ
jgi:hypothetical protein